jgi:hypothetical protein
LNKVVWGPKLWRLYHLIAQYSDRSDLIGDWRNLIRITPAVIACDKCRIHAIDYIKTHSISGKLFIMKNGHRGPMKIEINETPDEYRQRISRELCTFHNAVNKRLDKSLFNFEDLAKEYGIGRNEAIKEATKLMEELFETWKLAAAARLNDGHSVAEWYRLTKRLINYVALGAHKVR